MSNTMPTLERVIEMLSEQREQLAAIRTDVAAIKEELHKTNKAITLMNRDILDLRTTVASIDDRLERLESHNAPTQKI